MRIAARERQQQGHRRAQRRNLREREVHEDHPSLDDVHTEIGVNPGQDEAGRKRRRQKLQDRRIHRLTSRPAS